MTERRSGIRPGSVKSLASGLSLALLVTAALPGQAAAQQRGRTVFDMLFGGPPSYRREQPYVIERVTPRRQQAPRQRTSAPAREKPPAAARARNATAGAAVAAGATAAAPVEKREDAKKVLVVGDFMADALADGLETAFEGNAGILVVDKSNGSSGLVRDDHLDWPAKLGEMLDAEKPAVVAVMVGANDRQAIDLPGNSLPLRSDGWVAEYERRIADMLDVAAARNVPLVWVGMPSFKSDRMSGDMVFLNDLARKAMGNGAEYVDVWDGFVDANGAFAPSGPNVTGQSVQLRSSDGIALTDAGDEKLAFYAEKPILRLLGLNAEGTAIAAAPEALDKPGPSPANATAKAAVALSDPSFDGADTLLGEARRAGSSVTAELSPRDRLVLNGTGTGHLQGRADDFAWAEKGPAVAREPAPVAASGTIDLQSLRASPGLQPPPEMPDLMGAIIDEWDRENAAARAAGAGQTAPAGPQN